MKISTLRLSSGASLIRDLSTGLFALTASGLLFFTASTPASAAIVTSVSSDFTGATAPWDSGDWDHASQTSNKVESAPGNGEYQIIHSQGTGLAITVNVPQAAGAPQGGGLVSVNSLDTAILAAGGTLEATLTFGQPAAGGSWSRIILNDSAGNWFSSATNRFYAQVTHGFNNQTTIQLFQKSTNITGDLSYGSALGEGDRLLLQFNDDQLLSLSIYSASTGTTTELLSGPINFDHSVAWGVTDFSNGAYVGLEYGVFTNPEKDLPARSGYFKSISASVTPAQIPEQGSVALLAGIVGLLVPCLRRPAR